MGRVVHAHLNVRDPFPEHGRATASVTHLILSMENIECSYIINPVNLRRPLGSTNRRPTTCRQATRHCSPATVAPVRLSNGCSPVNKQRSNSLPCRSNASWHKSTESTFELAKHCAATNKELSAAAKKALMARLPFDRVTFSKLVKIGNDARLPRLMHQLPPSFSSLYEIAGFDETREPAVTVVGTP